MQNKSGVCYDTAECVCLNARSFIQFTFLFADCVSDACLKAVHRWCKIQSAVTTLKNPGIQADSSVRDS